MNLSAEQLPRIFMESMFYEPGDLINQFSFERERYAGKKKTT